jgi:hypothetical protein
MGLVGNKADNEHRRVIRVEKHNKLAEQNGAIFWFILFLAFILTISAMNSHFYVSAKTGDSIELMFKWILGEFTC